MFVSKFAPKRDPSCILKRELKNEKNNVNGQIISGPATCLDPPGKFVFLLQINLIHFCFSTW